MVLSSVEISGHRSPYILFFQVLDTPTKPIKKGGKPSHQEWERIQNFLEGWLCAQGYISSQVATLNVWM